MKRSRTKIYILYYSCLIACKSGLLKFILYIHILEDLNDVLIIFFYREKYLLIRF